jgi:hypothetical protein
MDKIKNPEISNYDDVYERWVDMGDGTHARQTVTSNITGEYRESFETYPNAGLLEQKASGDLVFVDGNAAAASYLVISKSPLAAGTETTVETVETFALPVEVTVGASMSQRTLGQEFAIELVDTQPELAPVADLAISSITQTTTVLTVDTTLPHGLSVGKSVGIFGCSNALANYPSIVVASVPSPTQFTATAGPGGTIASQTITNPVENKGFVYFRERLGRAQNGVAQVFETATATTASLYLRSESGDALPSGTISGAHGVTVGTTASVQLVNSPNQYAFTPTSEYRIFAQSDRVQFSDSLVDSLTQTNSRLMRTQVCPDTSVPYKLRFRATNNKSLTAPNATIISAVKTGTTTALITTGSPHGLVTGDPVVIYGIRDQAASAFPNLLTATAVGTVGSTTTFEIVIGTAATETSYGGYVAKVQGGNLMSALGANAAAVQSATLSTLSDGTRQLVLIGSANWTGLTTFGDMVEVVGCRADLTGASLGVDGPWKIANSATTTLTLVLPFVNQRVLPANFASADCGGGVIKRTDLRVSFARGNEYKRARVEMLPRPVGDLSGAVPTVIQGGTLTAVSGVTTVGTVTTVAAVTSAGTPLAPATPYILNSLATTNGALILTGSSGLQAFYATNIGATVAFVKLYNKATAPTVGTDVPVMIIPVPAAVAGVPGSVQITPGFNGYRFALGLGIAITGAAADADTTAVAAGQVKVILSRTV